MKLITLATILLFCVGAIFGLLILYANLTSNNEISNPNIISKDQAISIASKYGHFTQQDLDSDKIEAKLLQAPLSNRIAIVMNSTTLSAGTYPQVVPLTPFNVKENQLFWEVTISRYLSQYVSRQWMYEIDATNGTLIQSYSPYG